MFWCLLNNGMGMVYCNPLCFYLEDVLSHQWVIWELVFKRELHMYKRFQTLAYLCMYLVNNNKVLKYLMVLYLDAKISSPFHTLIAKSVLATLVTVDICHQFSNNQKCSRNSWKMHAPCYHNRILLHFQLKKFPSLPL